MLKHRNSNVIEAIARALMAPQTQRHQHIQFHFNMDDFKIPAALERDIWGEVGVDTPCMSYSDIGMDAVAVMDGHQLDICITLTHELLTGNRVTADRAVDYALTHVCVLCHAYSEMATGCGVAVSILKYGSERYTLTDLNNSFFYK